MTKKLKKTTALKKRAVVYPVGYTDYKNRNFDWAINTKYLYTERVCHGDFVPKYSLLMDSNLLGIIQKMDSYRGWIWKNIEMSNSGTSCGVMEVAKLDTREMVTKHLEYIKEDVDVIYKMEINNHHRVWGIRKQDCLYLVWNDRDHSFYKHKNKNYTQKKC